VELLSQAKIDELRATLSVDMRRHLHRVFADVLPARLDALELALRAGDEVERKRVGHLLSGSSAMVGATRLSELCGKLERAAPDAFVVDAAIAGLIAVAAETRAALERQLA
jgi:HPt (histidine-containing phosphotransfer) domain-containing protein